MKNKCLCLSLFSCSHSCVLLWQVHELDEQTWRTVEVVPIDIANKEEVAPGVSFNTGGVYGPHRPEYETICV